MRLAIAALVGITLVGCTLHQDEDNNLDGGYVPPVINPVNIPLTQANANLTIVQSLGDTDAGVTLTLTDSAGNPVILSSMQAVTINNQPVLGPNAMNQYGVVIPASSNYAVHVEEPTFGGGNTNLAPPAAYSITSPLPNAQASLQGFTLEWSPSDTALTATITLTQNAATGPQTANFNLASDTGSKTFADVDLKQFVQGYPLTVTLTKTLSQSTLVVFHSASTTITRSVSEVVQPGP